MVACRECPGIDHFTGRIRQKATFPARSAGSLGARPSGSVGRGLANRHTMLGRRAILGYGKQRCCAGGPFDLDAVPEIAHSRAVNP